MPQPVTEIRVDGDVIYLLRFSSREEFRALESVWVALLEIVNKKVPGVTCLRVAPSILNEKVKHQPFSLAPLSLIRSA